MPKFAQRNGRVSDIGVRNAVVAQILAHDKQMRKVARIVAHDERFVRLCNCRQHVRPVPYSLEEQPIALQTAAAHLL